jgi:hypothetical protein
MLKINIKIIFLVLLTALSSSCKKSFDTKEDFLEYIEDEDNGYSETKFINGIKINLTYKPTQLMVLQENSKGSDKINDSLKTKYENSIYFILSYSKDNKEILSTINDSRERFNNVQNELTFKMHENVSLTTESRDTIPLVDYNFPRTYGMSRSTNLLFVFKRDKLIDSGSNVFFNLKDIGMNIGDLKFKFKTKIIKE